MTVLRALYDATADGRIGTPQQRLAAVAAKRRRDTFLAWMRGLPLQEQQKIYFRLIAGDDPEELMK
jgi:hypothetical protein